MHAQVGDWLLVTGRGDKRRGEILAVPSPDGGPPYTVRWLDTGHTAIVFPEEGAVVVTAAEQAGADRETVNRVERLQDALVEREAAGGN